MKTVSCLSLVLILFLHLGARSVGAQNLIAVSDGRAEAGSSRPTNAEVQLLRRQALPKARQLWRGNDVCTESFEVIDAASGSFTKTNAAQRAVLYRFCVTGHDFANNGIAIIEGGKIVAHVLYEGGENNSLKAVADINSNGLSEIVLGDGSTHQGYTNVAAIVIEIAPSGVKKFGIADVYEDDCGAQERCKTLAYKLSAKPGAVPAFYRETYRKRGARWIRAASAVPYALRKDESSYQLVN